MKTEIPSFDEFFKSIQATEAADRERLIDQFKKGLEAGYHWMVECFDIDPTHERETDVNYRFCHTRLEAEKIWKEESDKSFYDNAIRAYDLNQSIDDGAELVADFWFDDE